MVGNGRMFVIAVATVAALLAPAASVAGDVRMIATVVTVTLAADGKSAVATLANRRDGSQVNVTVRDKATLDMLVDRRIKEGDEVRVSYDDSGGTNLSKTLKKSAGC